jgi:serine/threonine protein kinase
MAGKPPDPETPALAPTMGAGEGKDALPPDGPRAGVLLGKRYKMDVLLGVGGMGSVYRAVDEVLGKEVALKFLDEKLVLGQASFEWLRDEVLLAQEVSHKNVCRTYDLEEVDDRWVVKMEYIDGETLAQRVARVGRLDVSKTLAIARQIAEGLGAAHDRGVVHRDLKPHNVLLEAATGRVVLMDFGLARMAELAGRTAEGVAGTPEFMAPEQARGREVDGRADLYALGCVLYYMLVGEVVFPAKGAMAAALRHVEDPPPDVRAKRPDVPAWLAAVIARLLEKDPARRFPDARALLAALAPPRPRWPRVAAVGVAVVALGAAGLTWHALRPRPEWRPVVRELQPSYEENSDAPVFSPDGTLIAYGSDRERANHWRIYVDSLADGSSRAITAPALSPSFPIWTRDGGAILFGVRSGGHTDVLRVRLAGGEPELVVRGIANGAADCGAGRLVFVRPAGRESPFQRLVVRDADGAERDLVRVAPPDYVPYFRCDRAGTRVVYTLTRGIGGDGFFGRTDIRLIGLDGSRPRILTDDGKQNNFAPFHPDGRSIVFSSMRGGKHNLWELPLSGGPPAQLTFGEGPDWVPDISPDGQTILFDIDVTNVPIVAYGADGARRVLTSVAEETRKLAVAPDGRDLVAGVRRGGADYVVIVPTVGGEERTLAEGQAPSFTPAGTEVAYMVPGTPTRVYAIARAGGAPRLVGELPGQNGDLNVGPDGMIHVASLWPAARRRGASRCRGGRQSARRQPPGCMSFRRRQAAGVRRSGWRAVAWSLRTCSRRERGLTIRPRTRSGRMRWRGTGTALRWSTTMIPRCTVSIWQPAPMP